MYWCSLKVCDTVIFGYLGSVVESLWDQITEWWAHRKTKQVNVWVCEVGAFFHALSSAGPQSQTLKTSDLWHHLNQSALKNKANTTPPCALLCENPVTFCCLLLSDHILCSVNWLTDERVAVQWLTRKQNYLVVQIYDLDGSSWKESQVAVTWCTCWLHSRVRKCLITAINVFTLLRNSSKQARQAGSAM